MVDLRLVVGDPASKKTFQKVLSPAEAGRLAGLKVGSALKGDALGLTGYEFVVTGGSDKDGFPMRKDLPGPRRTKILVSKGHGFWPERKGTRRRKTMRGNSVSTEITQINLKVTTHGVKPIGDVLKPAEKKGDA